jgi:hypothetical protein
MNVLDTLWWKAFGPIPLGTVLTVGWDRLAAFEATAAIVRNSPSAFLAAVTNTMSRFKLLA